MKTLPTGITITYKHNGNIKALKSIFDNDVTSKPLNSLNTIKTHSSYAPLVQTTINNWFNKNFRHERI